MRHVEVLFGSRTTFTGLRGAGRTHEQLASSCTLFQPKSAWFTSPQGKI